MKRFNSRPFTLACLVAMLSAPGYTDPEGRAIETPAPAWALEQARDCGRIRHHAANEGAGAALPFARTELYFGAAMLDGVVAEEAFREFIDEHVTPLFPGGLTVFKTEGRFRTEQSIVKEPSFVLVLLYPCQELADGSQRIDRIRARYKERFAQRSVLRVDTQIVQVSY